MKGLIKILLEYIYNSKEIPDELLYEFSQKTMQIVQRKATEEIPDEFWDFENYVEMFWRGKKYNYMSDSCMVYQMGRLLACTNMLSILVDEREREASLEEYADLLKNRFEVFEGMYNTRGITHKELAELSGVSVSALSQFINRIKAEAFFTYRVMGREKHYYLTEYGEKLYFLMAQKNNKKKMKYAKLRGIVNDVNEQIMEDTYYKVIISQNANSVTESVYISNQERNGKRFENLLNISVNKNVFDSNREDDIWKIEKSEMLKMSSKIS